jgi:DNA-binding NtrC family response regulator
MLELKDFLIVESVEILKPSIDLKTQMDITENALLKNTEVFKLSIQKPLLPLQKVVQKYIEFAINRNGGAKDRTAKEIGIDRKTLYRKMKSFENYAH